MWRRVNARNNPPRGRPPAAGILAWLLWSVAIPLAADEAESPVAARVNNVPITVADVDYELRTALGTRSVPEETLPRLRAETLGRLIDRELVLVYLDQRRGAASTADVELALTQLEKELKLRGRTLADYCHELGRTPEQLRTALRWSLSWKRLLERSLTDANVERFFTNRRREYDGTRLRVAHVLLPLAADREEERQSRLAEADRLRQRIENGELTFAEAARQFSRAPTASQGGDIGWLERHEPMPEEFSAAAFQLQVGQVSHPVVTRAGVHLIQCLEEQPGTRQLADVRQELETAMTRHLFSWAADQVRGATSVEWTGAIPRTR